MTNPGWNSSEGINDRRVASIKDLKAIASGEVRRAQGGWIAVVNGPGNAFSGFPSYWHPELFQTRNAAIKQLCEFGVKQAFDWELDTDIQPDTALGAVNK